MKKKRILYIVLLTFVAFSCQKVIDLDVNDVEPQLVIEGNFDAVKEEVRVQISKTKDIFSAADFPVVIGAQVEIVDQANNVSILVDQGNGEYLLENYTPTYGNIYTMRVLVEGTLYEASDLLPSVVPIDSLSQDFQEESLFGEAGYVVFTNFTDPVTENFYRANRVINGDSLTDLGEQFLFDDGFSNGNSQAVPFFTTRQQVDDTIVVQFISYSQNSFDYYDQLFEIAGESGQSAAPANPDYSWTNEALGHFATYGYDIDTIIIQP
jgi:hypothetical protein